MDGVCWDNEKHDIDEEAGWGGAHCVEQEAAHEFVVKEKGLDSTGSLK